MSPQLRKELEQLSAKIMAHKGHVIQYFCSGHRNNFGTLERITIDEDHCSLKLWISQAPKEHSFMVPVHSVEQNQFAQIYVDQFCGCRDCLAKAKEPSRKVDIGTNIDPTRVKIRGKDAT
jgi:hypothetical protein